MLKTMFFGAAPLCLLAACAGTGADYNPIVDEPPSRALTENLAACKSLAETSSYTGAETRNNALIGAVIGAIAGAAEDGRLEDAAGGAIAGAVVGGGGAALDHQEKRSDIVRTCLEKRGHRVVG